LEVVARSFSRVVDMASGLVLSVEVDMWLLGHGGNLQLVVSDEGNRDWDHGGVWPLLL
jgi:hypothetical protein